jgi:large subunit ribosomal protein L15
MQIHDVRRPIGARQRRKIVGRGKGSGSGKTSGRGQGRNQKARSGRGIMFRLEGGQMPLMKRLPKVGFRSRHPIIYQLVDVGELSRLKAGTLVDAVILKEKGLIKSAFRPYKILGEGELKNPLTVQAYSFSKTALEKIQAAGGKADVITAKMVKAAFKVAEK